MNNRVYFLDTMRGILILLILIIHSLQVFNPKKTWLIYTDEGIDFVPYIIDFLMLFTLTSFFIMSGFFAAMSIHKVGSKKFLETRMKRILIPIFVTALILNSLQAYILIDNGWMEFELLVYIQKGGWVSHLWFLINLVIYFLILYIGVKFFKFMLKKIVVMIELLFLKTNISIILFLLSFLTVLLIAAMSMISKYWHFSEIINLHAIAFYLPFFFLGILMYHNKDMLEKFTKISINTFLFISLSLLLSHYLMDFEGNLYKFLYFFFFTVAHFFTSALCFHLFYKYANSKSRIFLFLSEASYSVYLFHHVLVVGVGLLFIKYGIGDIGGLFLLMFIVGTISLLIHALLISKINILSFLFNGKTMEKTEST